MRATDEPRDLRRRVPAERASDLAAEPLVNPRCCRRSHPASVTCPVERVCQLRNASTLVTDCTCCPQRFARARLWPTGRRRARAGRPASRRRRCTTSRRGLRRGSCPVAGRGRTSPVPRATGFHELWVSRCTSNGSRGETSARSLVPSARTFSLGATSSVIAPPATVLYASRSSVECRAGTLTVKRPAGVGWMRASVCQPTDVRICSRALPSPRTQPCTWTCAPNIAGAARCRRATSHAPRSRSTPARTSSAPPPPGTSASRAPSARARPSRGPDELPTTRMSRTPPTCNAAPTRDALRTDVGQT